MIGLRASDELRREIDAWAKRHPDKPNRSDAIRKLVEMGLSESKKIDDLAKMLARGDVTGALHAIGIDPSFASKREKK